MSDKVLIPEVVDDQDVPEDIIESEMLEKRHKPRSYGITAKAEGVIGSTVLTVLGLTLMVVGGVLTLTLIGAPVGIPLALIGLLLFTIGASQVLIPLMLFLLAMALIYKLLTGG